MTNEHEQSDDALAQLADWLRTEPPEWPLLDEQEMSDERMAQLAEQIIEAEVGPGRVPAGDARRKRRRRRIAVVGAPIVVVALAAAAWAVLREDATEATSFACIAPDVVAAIPNDGSSPIEVCRDLWEQGVIVPGASEAPSLVACVDERGMVAVVESHGQETCAERGWALWTDQPAYEAVGRAITVVRTDLHDRFKATGNGCATVADWRDGLANQPDAQDWTIEVDDGSSDANCYDVSTVDPTARRVTLLGARAEYSIGCDPRTGC